jgi:hypothetical protein
LAVISLISSFSKAFCCLDILLAVRSDCVEGVDFLGVAGARAISNSLKVILELRKQDTIVPSLPI